jgi:hypothetical protein
MRTKNSKSITPAESEHIGRVKELSCAVCDAPGPSDAHHIEQGMHFTVIPLCKDCHQGGFNGIHGQARIWKVMKKTELSCLNQTVARLAQKGVL